MAMGGSTTSSKIRRAARKMVVGIAACGSFSSRNTPLSPPAAMSESPLKPKNKLEVGIEANSITNIKDLTSKNICAICLEVLSYSSGSSPGQAIFTAQCSHAFHFSCISSNVRHGSITCPICRAHWTQLPRNINPPACSLSCNQNDPVFRILDDSIATFRVHRRSLLRSARYDDDDDPIGPDHTQNHPRIDLALIPLQPTVLTNPCCIQHQPSSHSSLQMLGIGHISNHHHHHHQFRSSSSSNLQLQPPSGQTHTYMCSSSNSRPAYLSIKLAQPRATDMVLIASPNGPHLRLLKQSMALVVFSLQPIDRLAIVTYSSAAARVFPLRRMTSYGKRSALQVIDRLFYMGEADPIEGIKKGIKILEDRAHKNPLSCLLHLSDSPTRSYHTMNLQLPLPVHRFHVGFGFGTSNGFLMREFEEFLTQLLGGVVREVQLRIGEEGRIIRLGDLRGGEERRILIDWGECVHVSVGYSYVEGGSDECIRTGETMVSAEDKRETEEDSNRESGISIVGGRTSSAENWDYRDPYMARRWAKHLHGYRGYEVREALRAQMEVQSKLHLQVEDEKHLQIRQDAERKHMAMLERACKMLSDHFIGSGAVTDTDNLEIGSKMLRNYSVDALGFYSTQSADILNACGQEEMPSGLHSQRADGSTKSCLTSQESPGGFTMEGSPVGGKKKMLNLEATTGSVIRGDARVNPQGLTGYGM